MADDRRPDGQQPGPSWGQPGQPGQQPGQMRYQDGDTTTPREPTLAEKKARERAYQRQQEQEATELAAARKKTDTRRRVMVGSGVSVGVVALVASFYSGYTYSMQKDAAQATCTAEHPETGETIAQPEEYCEDGYAQQHGHYNHSTGMMMMPIFLGGGNYGGSVPASQYKHSYSPVGSSTSAPGQKVNNPNFTKPSGQITSQSGKTIQRGGFGIGSKSGS